MSEYDEHGAGTGESMSEEEPHSHNEPPRMTVAQAIEFLQQVKNQDAYLAICAHGFPGMEDQAWYVSHLAPVTDEHGGERLVLVEGAGDPSKTQQG